MFLFGNDLHSKLTLIGHVRTGEASINDEQCVFPLYSYSSGGEDGYVRVHTFDPSYFEFKFE